MSDVYARGMSRSWRDRVFDVRLNVCGHEELLTRVRAALAEHPLRMLSIRKECVTPPPPQPPSPVAQPLQPSQPPSPTSPSPSTFSPVSYSSPFQQHQPFWISSASSPLSTAISTTSTPQRKLRHETSPPPPSVDSDETRLASSPHPSSDDKTRLPLPSFLLYMYSRSHGKVNIILPSISVPFPFHCRFLSVLFLFHLVPI